MILRCQSNNTPANTIEINDKQNSGCEVPVTPKAVKIIRLKAKNKQVNLVTFGKSYIDFTPKKIHVNPSKEKVNRPK